MATNVAVTFSATDEATEVARKLLETMRALEREQRANAQATAAAAKPAKEAADAFTRMRTALVGIKDTGGVDAISRRVAVLAQGLRSASTQAASLAKLTAAEAQLQKALRSTNLTLEQRITLERTLRQTQSAIAGQGAVSGLAGGAQSALAGLSKLQGVLGALGVAFSIAQITQFTKTVIDSADALNDLSKITGVSTESLSVFQQVAEKSGASVETIQTGFRNLARQVSALRAGNQEAVETFRAIGLSAEDLAGLSLDQIFVRIADAQAKFADGSGKLTVATRLFSRSGEELIPTLKELANGGFDNARKKAEELGGVVRGDVARAADQFNDDLADLKTATQGLTREFTSGLLPALSDAARDLTTIAAKSRESSSGLLRFFGALEGATLGAAIKSALLGTVLGPVGGVQVGSQGAAKRIAALAREMLGLKAATDATSTSFQRFGPTQEQLNTNRPKQDIIITDPALAKAQRAAELSALRQHTRDLLSIQQASLRQREQQEDAAFSANLVGFEQHFRQRLAIAREGTKAETDAITTEIATLRATPLTENTEAARIQRESEINSLVAQRQKISIDGETQVLALIAQQNAARKAAVTEIQALTAQLFRQQGEDLRASQLEIAAAADRFADTLRSQGFGEQIVADLRGAFSTLQTDIAAFQQSQRTAQQDLNTLALERAVIEQKLASGALGERDAQLAILDLERQHVPALRQAAQAMQFFADRVGDPALKAAAAQLLSQINSLGTGVDAATKKAIEFKDTLIDAVQQDVSNFLGAGINNAKNGLDALLNLARSLAETFQRITADLLTEQLFGKIRGALSGAGLSASAAQVASASVALNVAGNRVVQGGAAVLGAAGALAAAATLFLSAGTVSSATAGLSAARGIFAFASGGLVRGPGTGTSDSIHARLSAGEFVIRASAVRALGVEYLNALNGLRMPRVRSLDSAGVPRFADGGLVVEAPAAPTPSSVEADVRLSLEHTEDAQVRFLESPSGARVLTRYVERNAPAIRRILGS